MRMCLLLCLILARCHAHFTECSLLTEAIIQYLAGCSGVFRAISDCPGIDHVCTYANTYVRTCKRTIKTYLAVTTVAVVVKVKSVNFVWTTTDPVLHHFTECSLLTEAPSCWCLHSEYAVLSKQRAVGVSIVNYYLLKVQCSRNNFCHILIFVLFIVF